jgi:uncharacterized protein (TIGR02231 family)
MANLHPLACLLVLAATSLDPLVRAAEIESTITDVTVFPDRAMVTRSFSAKLQPGINQLILPALPNQLDANSLQVNGRGARASLLDATVQQMPPQQADTPAMAQVRAELQEAERALRRADDSLASLEVRRQFILNLTPPSLSPVSGRESIGRISPDDLAGLLGFIESGLDSILPQIAKLQEQRIELAARRDALAAQLQQFGAAGRVPRKSVILRIDAADAGNFEGSVSYVVPTAMWSPAYQARLTSGSEKLTLAYDAIVSQRTGEAWENVRLRLSTARPSLGGAAPEPLPWIVDVFQITAQEVRRDRALAAPAAGMALTKTANEADLFSPEASVETGLTSASFVITAPVTIPENGAQQRVSIGRLELDANLEYRATPALSPNAFLTAKVHNSSDLPLLPGELSAFLDGAFIARSNLKSAMPGEAFDLALGADERISIERTLVNRLTETVGITQRTTRLTYEFRTTLINNRSAPVTLILQDTLPVSRNERIVVRQIEPAERDRNVVRDAEGRMTWTLQLQPAERRVVPFRFSVEHPNDMNVSGLR